MSRARRFLSSVSVPWLIAACALILLAWGNSLVPGTGSSGMSLSVVDAARAFLSSFGLPGDWITNFFVRKTAHFTEYALIGFSMAQALDPERSLSRSALAATAVVLVLVPSIDETIQLFVDGRSGQVTDVLLDCCGAATGMAVRSAVAWVRRRQQRR